MLALGGRIDDRRAARERERAAEVVVDLALGLVELLEHAPSRADPLERVSGAGERLARRRVLRRADEREILRHRDGETEVVAGDEAVDGELRFLAPRLAAPGEDVGRAGLIAEGRADQDRVAVDLRSRRRSFLLGAVVGDQLRDARRGDAPLKSKA